MGQHSHLYTTWKWRLRRKAHLQQHPLCQRCLDVHNRVTQATIAHHITPHNGDLNAFYRGALMSLCQQCHDSDAQSLEKGGVPRSTIGLDGWPIDR
jgi:5-methylcytosine-specific restriction endonuclease McrA